MVRSGARGKVLAVLTDPLVVGKFLEAMGEFTHTPTLTPARGPPMHEDAQITMAW